MGKAPRVLDLTARVEEGSNCSEDLRVLGVGIGTLEVLKYELAPVRAALLKADKSRLSFVLLDFV